MKRSAFVILMTTLTAGFAYASVEVADSQMAVSMPAPSTIFICTAGVAFFRYLTRRIP